MQANLLGRQASPGRVPLLCAAPVSSSPASRCRSAELLVPSGSRERQGHEFATCFFFPRGLVSPCPRSQGQGLQPCHRGWLSPGAVVLSVVGIKSGEPLREGLLSCVNEAEGCPGTGACRGVSHAKQEQRVRVSQDVEMQVLEKR